MEGKNLNWGASPEDLVDETSIFEDENKEKEKENVKRLKDPMGGKILVCEKPFGGFNAGDAVKTSNKNGMFKIKLFDLGKNELIKDENWIAVESGEDFEDFSNSFVLKVEEKDQMGTETEKEAPKQNKELETIEIAVEKKTEEIKLLLEELQKKSFEGLANLTVSDLEKEIKKIDNYTEDKDLMTKIGNGKIDLLRYGKEMRRLLYEKQEKESGAEETEEEKIDKGVDPREMNRTLKEFRDNGIKLKIKEGGGANFIINELPGKDHREYVVLKNMEDEGDIRTISRDVLYKLNPEEAELRRAVKEEIKEAEDIATEKIIREETADDFTRAQRNAEALKNITDEKIKQKIEPEEPIDEQLKDIPNAKDFGNYINKETEFQTGKPGEKEQPVEEIPEGKIISRESREKTRERAARIHKIITDNPDMSDKEREVLEKEEINNVALTLGAELIIASYEKDPEKRRKEYGAVAEGIKAALLLYKERELKDAEIELTKAKTEAYKKFGIATEEKIKGTGFKEDKKETEKSKKSWFSRKTQWLMDGTEERIFGNSTRENREQEVTDEEFKKAVVVAFVEVSKEKGEADEIREAFKEGAKRKINLDVIEEIIKKLPEDLRSAVEENGELKEKIGKISLGLDDFEDLLEKEEKVDVEEKERNKAPDETEKEINEKEETGEVTEEKDEVGLKEFFKGMGKGITESMIKKAAEDDAKIRAAIKDNNKSAQKKLKEDFYNFFEEPWTEDFSLADFKKNYEIKNNLKNIFEEKFSRDELMDIWNIIEKEKEEDKIEKMITDKAAFEKMTKGEVEFDKIKRLKVRELKYIVGIKINEKAKKADKEKTENAPGKNEIKEEIKGDTQEQKAQEIATFFERLGQAMKEYAPKAVEEYDKRIRAVIGGKPIKEGDTIENLKKSFSKCALGQEWSPTFNLDNFKKRYEIQSGLLTMMRGVKKDLERENILKSFYNILVEKEEGNKIYQEISEQVFKNVTSSDKTGFDAIKDLTVGDVKGEVDFMINRLIKD